VDKVQGQELGPQHYGYLDSYVEKVVYEDKPRLPRLQNILSFPETTGPGETTIKLIEQDGEEQPLMNYFYKLKIGVLDEVFAFSPPLFLVDYYRRGIPETLLPTTSC
jgi:hypothetical protein